MQQELYERDYYDLIAEQHEADVQQELLEKIERTQDDPTCFICRYGLRSKTVHQEIFQAENAAHEICLTVARDFVAEGKPLPSHLKVEMIPEAK